MVGTSCNTSDPPVAKSFRWEIVVAAFCFFVFWVDVSMYRLLRGPSPGEAFQRLAWHVPCFVLTPALAISVLRNPRASRLAKWSAVGILALYLWSPEFWYATSRIISALSYLSG